MTPDDAEATARGFWKSGTATSGWLDAHNDHVATTCCHKVERLAGLNADLLTEVRRTLALFEAIGVDLDEVERLRELVSRAEGK